MIVRRAIIILVVAFTAINAWFNYPPLKESFLAFIGYDKAVEAQIDNGLTLEPKVYPLPLSEDKVPSTNATITPQAPKRVVSAPKTAGYSLSIPSLRVNAPIILEPSKDNDKIFKQLESGVVHYSASVMPGQAGASVIIGHSSVYPWYKGSYGYVFASLSKLKEGESIYVNNGNTTLHFKVTRTLIFPPVGYDEAELKSLEAGQMPALILMTCWPNGTNAKRIAVRAELVQ